MINKVADVFGMTGSWRMGLCARWKWDSHRVALKPWKISLPIPQILLNLRALCHEVYVLGLGIVSKGFEPLTYLCRMCLFLLILKIMCSVRHVLECVFFELALSSSIFPQLALHLSHTTELMEFD